MACNVANHRATTIKKAVRGHQCPPADGLSDEISPLRPATPLRDSGRNDAVGWR